jgi:hypothetical protein
MAATGVLSEPAVDEPEDPPARMSGRRVLRWVAVLTIGVVAVLAIWQDPLYAGR